MILTKDRSAITADHLSYQLNKRMILNNIFVDLRFGELTTLLGPNGAGKSTLLKILCQDIEIPNEIFYFGHKLTTWDKKEKAQHVGILPQSSSLSFNFTVQEVVELGALPLDLSQKQITELSHQMMQKTDIVHLADRLYPSLSGGEKQRVHLARVLTQISQAKDKKVLMLDEPTSALDLAHQHNTLKLAKELAQQGAAVIVVLHDLNLAAQYSDRLLVLEQGELKADGTPWEVITPTLIKETYGQETLVKKHPTQDYPVVYAQ